MTGKAHLGTHFIVVQVLCRGVVVGFKETSHSNSIFSKSRVCRNYRHCMSSCLDEKNVKRPVAELARTNNHFLWQQFCHCLVKESCVSQENQTHRYKVSFIRELVNNKEIFLEFCISEDQLIDIFTKPLARDTFEYLRSDLGMTSSTQWTLSWTEHVFFSETFCNIFVLNFDMLIIKGDCWKH